MATIASPRQCSKLHYVVSPSPLFAHHPLFRHVRTVCECASLKSVHATRILLGRLSALERSRTKFKEGSVLPFSPSRLGRREGTPKVEVCDTCCTYVGTVMMTGETGFLQASAGARSGGGREGCVGDASSGQSAEMGGGRCGSACRRRHGALSPRRAGGP